MCIVQDNTGNSAPCLCFLNETIYVSLVSYNLYPCLVRKGVQGDYGVHPLSSNLKYTFSMSLHQSRAFRDVGSTLPAQRNHHSAASPQHLLNSTLYTFLQVRVQRVHVHICAAPPREAFRPRVHCLSTPLQVFSLLFPADSPSIL